MIRNLKVLVAAAMALGAFGVFSASGAQAAEFHCSVELCTGTLKPDEAAGTKTAHHVFIIENEKATEAVSFTCSQLDGEGVSSNKTQSAIEIQNLSYTGCLVNGGAGLTLDMNGCKYNLTAAGAMSITGCTSASKQIEGTISGCTYAIPEQGPLTGITYHNIGTAPNRQVTVSMNVKGVKVTVSGSQANCFINPNQSLSATFTTGNTIVTGETGAGVMADAWWE